MIYVATPYSDSNPEIREERYRKACEIAYLIAKRNVPCYVPIAFWVSIGEEYRLPDDAEFWTIQDHDLLALSSELWIITLEGWNRSKGIEMERAEFCKIHGAGKIFLYSQFEIAFACEEYHERRDAQRNILVSEQMKTAGVAVGFGEDHIEGDHEHRRIITERQG